MLPSSSSAMKSSLVVVLLLLSAVVASQAHPVAFTNKCRKPVIVSKIWCFPGQTVLVNGDPLIVVEAIDKTGIHHDGPFHCPRDVVAVDIVYENEIQCVLFKITKVLSLVGEVLDGSHRQSVPVICHFPL